MKDITKEQPTDRKKHIKWAVIENGKTVYIWHGWGTFTVSGKLVLPTHWEYVEKKTKQNENDKTKRRIHRRGVTQKN